MINIDELPEGGMGIMLMSQIADDLSYTRPSALQNCLLIAKNYDQLEKIENVKTTFNNVFDQLLDTLSGFNWLRGKGDELDKNSQDFAQISLQVLSDLGELEKILYWFDQLEKLPIPRDVWWKCRLALAEGFTNAVRHAHKDLPLETPIDLEITVSPSRIEIRIWDYGNPFNLVPKNQVSSGDEESPFSHLDLMNDVQSLIN